MQVDITEAGSNDSEWSPSPTESYIWLKPVTNMMDESEGEYESWGGFESGVYLIQHHQH